MTGLDWLRVRMAEVRAGWFAPATTGRRRWPWVLGAVVLLAGLAVWIAGAVVAAQMAPVARERIVALLEAQLGSPVRVGTVETHFDGDVRVDVDGLEAQSVLRGVVGDPARPMLRVSHLRAHVGLMGALMGGVFGGGAKGERGMGPALQHLSGVVLDGAEVRFENGAGGRAPLMFDLPHVELSGLDRLGNQGTFSYKATVDAGAPVGLVKTEGMMGPWNAGDPRATPLKGTFSFEKRDMSGVHGLHGLLSMRANYSGTLSQMESDGTTEDPAFGLDVSAHTVLLRTQFKLFIDAVHGVVTMQALDARFLQTHFLLSGTITKSAPTGGYVLAMGLTVPEGRVEDALLLGAPTEPPLLRGGLTMQGRLLLPAGETSVSRRLQLHDGRFRLTGVQFGRAAVQRSANALSDKASGNPEEAKAGGAAASFAQVSGDVTLDNGTMQMSRVRLTAPGTVLALAGHYLLGGGGFAMRGTLHTEATASEMQTGMKHMLLRPFNGLFGHGKAGTTLPLEVTGSGNTPHFTVTLPGGTKMDALE